MKSITGKQYMKIVHEQYMKQYMKIVHEQYMKQYMKLVHELST